MGKQGGRTKCGGGGGGGNDDACDSGHAGVDRGEREAKENSVWQCTGSLSAEGNHLNDRNVKVDFVRAGERLVFKGSTTLRFALGQILAHVEAHASAVADGEGVVGGCLEELLRVGQLRGVAALAHPVILDHVRRQTEQKGLPVAKVLTRFDRFKSLRPGCRTVSTKDLNGKMEQVAVGH